MDPTQTDVNTEQPVAASGVVEAAAPTEGVNQEAAPDKSVQTQEAGVQQSEASAQGTEQVLADGTQADKPVEYNRFKEVNDAKKAAEERIGQLEQYVRLQQANPPQQQAQQQQPQSVTLQVMKELDIDPEDIMTGQQQAQVNDEVTRRTAAVTQSQFQVQSFIASKPDFAQVVGIVDPLTGQFIYAQPMLRVFQTNPGIMQALQSAGAGGFQLAYKIASQDPTYMAEVAKATANPVVAASEKANQVIQNANSMTSVSAVAGAGTLDRKAAILALSDEEFKNLVETVKARA